MSGPSVPVLGVPAIDAAIAALMAAGQRLAQAKEWESLLEFGRHSAKSDAIARIMSLPDPQKDNKPYSATAAEKLVETDAGYAAHLASQREAAKATIIAQTEYHAHQFACRYVTAGSEVTA